MQLRNAKEKVKILDIVDVLKGIREDAKNQVTPTQRAMIAFDDIVDTSTDLDELTMKFKMEFKKKFKSVMDIITHLSLKYR